MRKYKTPRPQCADARLEATPGQSLQDLDDFSRLFSSAPSRVQPWTPSSARSTAAPAPLDISPSWFSGPREVPAALRGPIHVPATTSFVSLLQLRKDFFADADDEIMDLQPFVGDVSLKWEVDSLDIVNAPYLFYDEHGSFAPANVLLYRRAETALRYSSIAPNALLIVRLRGEQEARPALWSELIDPAIPTFRYVDSCMVNTDRYLRPLLEYAIGGGCEVTTVCGGKYGPELRVLLPGADGYRKANLMDIAGSTPLLVLRAIGQADDEVAESLGRFQDRTDQSPSLPGIIADGKLVGSGKYTPIEYRQPLREILNGLRGLGLIRRCPESGAIILGEAGARLLDVLTPRIFDSDARLRWIDPETDLFQPEHADASERWLRSFYGELRKVALRHCGHPRSSSNIALELLDMLIGDDT